jgi:hypothetical protein
VAVIGQQRDTEQSLVIVVRVSPTPRQELSGRGINYDQVSLASDGNASPSLGQSERAGRACAVMPP